MAPSLGLVLGPAGPANRARATVAAFNADGLPVVAATDDGGPALLDLGRLEGYDVLVAVDPGVEFIAPFRADHFVDSDGTPFTVASEWAERRVCGGDNAGLERVRTELGVTDPRMLTGLGLAVLSVPALRAFEGQVLRPRGWTSADARAICADELAWYTAWIQQSGEIPLHLREPLVAMIDTPAAQLSAEIAGVTTADLARSYLGAVWPDAPGARASRVDALAGEMGVGSLSSALGRRVTRKVPSIQRMLGWNDG